MRPRMHRLKQIDFRDTQRCALSKRSATVNWLNYTPLRSLYILLKTRMQN